MALNSYKKTIWKPSDFSIYRMAFISWNCALDWILSFLFLILCFALGYFVTFSWVHTFAFSVYEVIRYVLGGPSSLSVFFFRFLLLTLLYQFSSYLSILYFDFLFISNFYSVSFYIIIFIFRLLYSKVPAGLVLKRIPQGLIQ